MRRPATPFLLALAALSIAGCAAKDEASTDPSVRLPVVTQADGAPVVSTTSAADLPVECREFNQIGVLEMGLGSAPIEKRQDVLDAMTGYADKLKTQFPELTESLDARLAAAVPVVAGDAVTPEQIAAVDQTNDVAIAWFKKTCG